MKKMKLMFSFALVSCLSTTSYVNVFADSDESLGDKVSQALSNTLMGMGTVFTVLILISLIISCFIFIPKLTEALEKRKTVTEEPVLAEERTQPVAEEKVSDDYELIAVIAAAIAASENTSTDSFVVRSIRRR
jgi:Na+-transporting methylmalonyl-CoA/oxaloacetate decarboxylase gamma subunit